MSRKIYAGLAVLALVAAAAGGGVYFQAKRATAAQVDAMLARAVERGVYSEAEYESLDLALDGEVTLHGLRLVQDLTREQGPDIPLEVILEEVAVHDYDLGHEFPHRVSLQIRGLGFPRGLPLPQGTPPNALGAYLASKMEGDTLPVVIDYHYDYQPEQAQRTRSRFGLSLENAGAASLRATLENLPLPAMAAASAGDDIQMAQMRALAFLSEAKIPEAGFAITDRGMVEGMLQVGADRANISAEAYRESLMAQISTLQLFVPQSLQSFAGRLSGALASFLEGGKTLDIAIQPEFGGDVRQLQTALIGAFFTQDYGTIVNLLNLEVKTADPVGPEPAIAAGGEQ